MTGADHADLSRRLALAIGYAPKDVRVRRVLKDPVCEVRRIVLNGWRYWRFFDYRDEFVAWAVAERYNAFPSLVAGKWVCFWAEGSSDAPYPQAPTAAEAVARAVVGALG